MNAHCRRDTSYSHFPIQFSANGDRLLISLINVDEMEDISYWTKFLSYNLETDELEELIRLDGTSISFWHLMNDNQIVGVSGRVLVKVNLTEAKYDTLFDYNYYAQPTELLVSKSSIEFIVEARQNLSSLSYNLESNEVEEIFLASTTSFSSIYNENLLTIEGQGTNTLKLRKAGLYALVTNEKKMKLNNFNSFWDSENNIYLMTKTGILKVDNQLNQLDKLNCQTPHIKDVIGDWIIYSTRKESSDINTAKHFATNTSFDKTIELPFLNNRKSLVLIKKRP